jgi:hypothetical protein
VKVVSDASPLISLAKIDLLHLLPQLYGRIHIPAEVVAEVAGAGLDKSGAKQIAAAGWIEVTPVSKPEALGNAIRETGLGAGEVSAIVLAKEITADLTLIDERKARRYARAEGLEVIGCLGILETLHRRGQLSDLRDAYLRLLRCRFRIDRQAMQDSLARFKLPPL